MNHHTNSPDAPFPVDARRLIPGTCLAFDLYTRHGVLLVTRATALDERTVRALAAIEDPELFAGADPTKPAPPKRRPQQQSNTESSSRPITHRLVSVDATPDHEYDEPEHHPFGDEFGPVRTNNPDHALRQRANRLKKADHTVAQHERSWRALPRRIQTSPAHLGTTPSNGVDWPDERDLPVMLRTLATRFRPLYAHTIAGLGCELVQLVALVDDLVTLYDRWPDRVAQLIVPTHDDPGNLVVHALRTGLLSVSIACRLGWSLDDTRLAGLAGLMCDTGMALVPGTIRTSNAPLDEFAASRVYRHPSLSVALLDTVEGMPGAVTLAAYQHHERLDGKGYPRAQRGDEIGDLARVVSVADAYAAAVASRPFRPAVRPYDALEDLILLASRDGLDRAVVRALIEVVGLAPVGGYIRLSTGERARVIGVTLGAIDRPVVRIDEEHAAPRTIDLASIDPTELHIISAADPPFWVRSGILDGALARHAA